MNEEFMEKKQAVFSARRTGAPIASSKNRDFIPLRTKERDLSVSPSIPTKINPELENQFVAAVESAMEGPLLRYSKRIELLTMAEKLGIGRFQANLLIAQAQQRTGRADEILIASLPQKKSQPESKDFTLRDRLFLFAALLIIAAVVDLALIHFVLTK
jgi:hypothetical protein